MKNDSNLFFTCSLIEFIGRRQKLKRPEVAAGLGEKNLRQEWAFPRRQATMKSSHSSVMSGNESTFRFLFDSG